MVLHPVIRFQYIDTKAFLYWASTLVHLHNWKHDFSIDIVKTALTLWSDHTLYSKRYTFFFVSIRKLSIYLIRRSLFKMEGKTTKTEKKLKFNLMNSFRICTNTKVNELLFTSIDIFLGRWNLFYDFIMWIVLSERVFIYVCVCLCVTLCVYIGKDSRNHISSCCDS